MGTKIRNFAARDPEEGERPLPPALRDAGRPEPQRQDLCQQERSGLSILAAEDHNVGSDKMCCGAAERAGARPGLSDAANKGAPWSR